MKKLLLAHLLLSQLAFSQGQPWCQPGATWHYSAGGLTVQGYVKLTQIGTIQIGTHLCDNYSATLKITPPPFVSSFWTFNTYFENNKVYAFRNSTNSFFKLYDFNAQIGDSWYIYPDYPETDCIEDSSLVEVDSITNVILSGDTLKKFFISYNNHSTIAPGWGIGSSYTEKIGSDWYLFPERINCLADGVGAYAIRCYSDSSNWSYTSGIAFTCDDILSVKNYPQLENSTISVYPNPSKQNFKIQIPTAFDWNELIVYNAQGKEVLKKINSINENEVFISENLVNGVYFLRVIGRERSETCQFIVD